MSKVIMENFLMPEDKKPDTQKLLTYQLKDRISHMAMSSHRVVIEDFEEYIVNDNSGYASYHAVCLSCLRDSADNRTFVNPVQFIEALKQIKKGIKDGKKNPALLYIDVNQYDMYLYGQSTITEVNKNGVLELNRTESIKLNVDSQVKMKYCFKLKYVLDILSLIDKQNELELYFGTIEYHPLVLKIGKYLCLILPIRYC